MHVLVFCAISLIWSASYILMKKAAAAYGPLTIGSLRLLGGLLILALLARLIGRGWRPRGRAWLWLSAIVVCGYAWPYALQPWLVARHPSGYIGMLVGFVPLATLLVQRPLLGSRPSRREWSGVLAGLACLWLIVEDGQARDIPWPHLLLAVTVPTGYAISNTLVKRQFATVPTLPLTEWCLGLGALLLLPLAAGSEPLPGDDTPLLWPTLAVLILGTIGTGLAIAGLYLLIQRRGPLWAGMIAYIIPSGALIWGWIDGEAVTGRQLAALAGILAMVALVQRQPRMKEPTTTSSPPADEIHEQPRD